MQFWTKTKSRALNLPFEQTIIPSWDIQLILLSAGMLVALIHIDSSNLVLDLLRLGLGLAHALYVPGFCLMLALFPRHGDLDRVTRIALSFGGSAAVLPFIAVLLDLVPGAGGIRPWPIVRILMLWMVTMCSIALWRRRRNISRGSAYIPAISRLPHWWVELELKSKLRYGIGVLALATLVIGGTSFLVSAISQSQLTEFYILGQENQLEAYPRTATLGVPMSMPMGIVNREGSTHTYTVEVWVEDTWNPDRRERVATSDALILATGQRVDVDLAWQMPWQGEDQRIEFLLYIDGQDDPYRQLHIILDDVVATTQQ